MAGDPRTLDEALAGVPMARSLTLGACEHGTVFLRLHDEDGEVFAAAMLPPDIAASINADLTVILEMVASGVDPSGATH